MKYIQTLITHFELITNSLYQQCTSPLIKTGWYSAPPAKRSIFQIHGSYVEYNSSQVDNNSKTVS